MGKDGILSRLKSTEPWKRASYSNVSDSEVNVDALEVWRGLPEIIRQDSSLASFRQQHEKLRGGQPQDNNDEHDIDPLPSHDQFPDTGTVLDIHQLELDNPKLKQSKLENCADKVQKGNAQNMLKKWFNRGKTVFLLLVWAAFTLILMSKGEKVLQFRQIVMPINITKTFVLSEPPINSRIGIVLRGPFLLDHEESTSFLHVDVQLLYESFHNTTDIPIKYSEIITSTHVLRFADEVVLDTITLTKKSIVFDINDIAYSKIHSGNSTLNVRFHTINTVMPVSLQFAYDSSPLDKAMGIIFGGLLLIVLYVLICSEIVHRTFASVLASTMGIAILAAMNEKPSMSLIISWIDVETLLLLFGMMILVAILSETGIFDYLAVFAYKITGGKLWPLINCICLFTAVTSSCLDNVTTILLMSPVIIRLCEEMGLKPVPILMAAVIFSNVGGTCTPIGDPPNVIIASNSKILKGGINFMNFTMHMTGGILLVLVQMFLQLRFQYRDISKLRCSEPQSVQDLQREIKVWERAAASISSYSKGEVLVRDTLLKKVKRLSKQLKKSKASGSIPVENYQSTLREMQAKYPIRNKKLLIHCCITLVFCISFFFLHSMPQIQHMSLGWTALVGAVLLLILSDRDDIEAILARVEWTTLLFFASLFILVESVAELGLIGWIGKQTEAVIMLVSDEYRLAVAILLILWVSAIVSGFVDNIPLTTMMVKIVISLAENKSLGLPLQPLVWAMDFGVCLGGNGTLIAASANVVCAGIAEQHGYRFTFNEFFKVGYPFMLGSIIVATCYLMLCHVVFQWH